MAEQENLFERLAKEKNTTVKDIRSQITARIEAGLHDPDPERRAQWERIPCVGEIPTPEEWLRYAVERIREEGGEDFLKRYLIDG